jgi:hypothetical protein
MSLAIFGHHRHAATRPVDASHEDALPSSSISVDFSSFTVHEAVVTMAE